MKLFWARKYSQGNYGYLNALMRARSSLFLKKEDYLRLSEGDLEALEQFLLDSRYAESYRSALVIGERSILSRVETAVANYICGELRHFHHIAEGEASILLGLILARADILNSRLIMRAAYTGRFGGKQPRWHDYGSLPGSLFSDLWQNSSGLSDVIERCHNHGHDFSLALADALVDIRRGYDLFRAERGFLLSILDNFWERLERSGTTNGKMVKDLLGMIIDTWNLGIWLKHRYGYPLPGKEDVLYLPSGKWLDQTRLSSTKVLNDLVKGTPWTGIIRTIENQRPQDFQRSISIYMWTWQRKYFRKDPLGIAVAIGYVAKELIEWENLNLISVGLAVGMKEREIFERLIPV
ncbi:MAG: V-type ATPase subunit [Synergistales bacterium]|nr:V-type ATPase subunit [Synergistales bacterium]